MITGRRQNLHTLRLTEVFYDGSQRDPTRAPRWRDWHLSTAIPQTLIIRPQWSWEEITGGKADEQSRYADLEAPEYKAASVQKAKLREVRKRKDHATRVMQSSGHFYNPATRSWMPPQAID